MATGKPLTLTLTCPYCGDTLTASMRVTLLRTLSAPLRAIARLGADTTQIKAHIADHTI